MSNLKKLLLERVDGMLVLLVSFVLLLAFLFLYLQRVDVNIQNYYKYKKSMVKIQTYNQDFDNTLMRSYRYLDNDKITQTSKKFDTELLYLEQNKLTYELGKEVVNQLHTISNKYKAKTEFIESFKTLNARITSSVYYLYELQKQVVSGKYSNIQVENLMGIILFKVGQIFLGTKLEVLNIEKYLIKLNTYRSMNKDIDYFYRHTRQLLIDVRQLIEVLEKNNLLNLDSSIVQMNKLLDSAYLKNQKTEENISIAFFIFAFIILIILIKTYLNMLKNKKEILYLAYHDTLTNLPNRTKFEDYISTLIQRNKLKYQFVVLYIDLDRFKIINDTLGHDIGDEMLMILSKRICSVLSKKNMLARIGGDEFVAIIEKKRNIENIDKLVKKVSSVIRQPIHIKKYNLNTTASIGIVKYPEDGITKSTLLKHADSAMYHAKDKGGDTYAFYNKQLSIDIQRRLELEQALVHALKNEEFSLCFQPQYYLQTQEICGVESLVRWENEILGDISPEEFIPVAEDTGFIVELGYYIFREACMAYMDWKKHDVNINLIAINISSVQLRQLDAFENFKKIIEETGINAKHIEIELTERYIMEYTTEKLTILDDLRNLGCRISIDDFGTGYSSMSYLKSLAIDTIKIDKSFILDLLENQHDAEVSKAIIVLSQSLGYKVIAEGIETVEQEQLLKSYKCDMGQGYYFARPMASNKIISFYHHKKIKS